MRTLSRVEAGVGKITAVFFALVIGVVFYSVYNIAPFYYYYYELLNQFDAAIRVASEYNDKEIRNKLVYHIKKMQIPCDPEELRIERYDDRMKISLDYTEVFYITWDGKDHTIYEFPFHAEVDRPYAGPKTKEQMPAF